jgi:hypothetical protein
MLSCSSPSTMHHMQLMSKKIILGQEKHVIQTLLTLDSNNLARAEYHRWRVKSFNAIGKRHDK